MNHNEKKRKHDKIENVEEERIGEIIVIEVRNLFREGEYEKVKDIGEFRAKVAKRISSRYPGNILKNDPNLEFHKTVIIEELQKQTNEKRKQDEAEERENKKLFGGEKKRKYEKQKKEKDQEENEKQKEENIAKQKKELKEIVTAESGIVPGESMKKKVVQDFLLVSRVTNPEDTSVENYFARFHNFRKKDYVEIAVWTHHDFADPDSKNPDKCKKLDRKLNFPKEVFFKMIKKKDALLEKSTQVFGSD